MFKAPFSFNGRIHRQEYLISCVIYFAVIMFFAFAVDELVPRRSEGLRTGLTVFVLVFAFWFIFAQGAKRSHDLGNSGWFVLVPLYGLWLLFGDSVPGANEYGPNPKGIGNEGFSFERET